LEDADDPVGVRSPGLHLLHHHRQGGSLQGDLSVVRSPFFPIGCINLKGEENYHNFKSVLAE
jgi:hypothetical protein